MAWTVGRGKLGRLKPLLGNWRTEADPAATGPSAIACTRSFTMFGDQWILLDALWQTAPDAAYRELAFFGLDADGAITCHSFTNNGKRSTGHIADGRDVSPEVIAFEAEMPAGLARMLYWPRDDGAPGFCFAVESRTKTGWNRFLLQRFVPA